MTERLTETQIHEWLDQNGYLDQSHNEGCYSIVLHIPTDPEQAWHDEKDVEPPQTGFFDAIKEQGLIYVGRAYKSVYSRLLDHGNGNVRQPSIIAVYEPIGMHGVSFDIREYNYALRVHQESDCATWYNGEVLL